MASPTLGAVLATRHAAAPSGEASTWHTLASEQQAYIDELEREVGQLDTALRGAERADKQWSRRLSSPPPPRRPSPPRVAAELRQIKEARDRWQRQAAAVEPGRAVGVDPRASRAGGGPRPISRTPLRPRSERGDLEAAKADNSRLHDDVEQLEHRAGGLISANEVRASANRKRASLPDPVCPSSPSCPCPPCHQQRSGGEQAPRPHIRALRV
jgi:hypothetical protein